MKLASFSEDSSTPEAADDGIYGDADIDEAEGDSAERSELEVGAEEDDGLEGDEHGESDGGAEGEEEIDEDGEDEGTEGDELDEGEEESEDEGDVEEESDDDTEIDDDEESDEDEEDEYDPFVEPIILDVGQAKVSTQFSYSLQDLLFPVTLSDGSPATERDRIRNWTASTELRYGLVDNIEVRATLPLRFLKVEFTDTEFEESDGEAGLADTSAGLTMLLLSGEPGYTNVLGTFDVNFPTGGDPFELSAFDNAFDSGFWFFTGGIEFLRSNEDEDVTLFGGASYSHFLAKTYSATRVEKADAISWFLGASWYINDNYFLEAQFLGDYQGNSAFDGVEALGTSFEPIAMRVAIGHEMANGRSIEPFVQYGLNDDLSTTTIGVSISRFHP